MDQAYWQSAIAGKASAAAKVLGASFPISRSADTACICVAVSEVEIYLPQALSA